MKAADIPFLLSAIGFTFGCLVMVFGAVLHNRYAYGASYNSALHVHIPPALVMIIGGAIAILGVVGMIGSVLRQRM
jgi:hypothetical protein